MKGIILAGGSGTRLYPATKALNKQLVPIYDKPMVYYPLSLLMLAQLKDILIITTPDDIFYFKRLLGDGSQWGINIEYQEQVQPNGLAEAFILGEDFLAGDDACLVLGDNIFYGHGLTQSLLKARFSVEERGGAYVFGYHVKDPERYGVVEFDEQKRVVSLEEKPPMPKSHYAVTGLYFYDNQVCELAKQVKPSSRGELEITDLNKLYLEQQALNVELLGRGYAWLDTGTHDSLIEASHFVSAVEKRQGHKLGCVEEIAYANHWIDKQHLLQLAKPMQKTGYGQYLREIAETVEPDEANNFIQRLNLSIDKQLVREG